MSQVDIFISYARRDSARVAPLVRLLEDRNWNTFIDDQIATGDNFSDVIEKALHSARCVLVIWSQHSLDSNWVRNEADVARVRGTLMPILLDDTDPPLGFRLAQTLSLANWNGQPGEPTIDRLIADIAGRLQAPLNKGRTTASNIARKPASGMSPTPHRVRMPIDEDSVLHALEGGSIRDVIVFCEVGGTDDDECWDATPRQMMGEALMSRIDFAEHRINVSNLDRARLDTLADQLTLWLKTHLVRYKRIYLVAHHVGGLVIRRACHKQLQQPDTSADSLSGRVQHAFLVLSKGSLGSHGAGDWATKLKELLFRSASATDLDTLSMQVFVDYQHVIAIAEQGDIDRPGFSIFVPGDTAGSRRDLAATKDDTFEGPLQGSARDIKADKTFDVTLVKRISTLLADQVTRSTDVYRERLAVQKRSAARNLNAGPEPVRASTPQRPQANNSGVPTRDVIIVACSATKNNNENLLHSGQDGIWTALVDPDVAHWAVETRVKIKGLIEAGKLDGAEFRAGNRAARPQNRALHFGPDFGGRLNDMVYLPAYRRYMGRCYQASTAEWQQFFERDEAERPDILIMSGLYGLFPAEEYIQNYDCLITDIDKQAGLDVRTYWQDVMTETLISRLEWHKNRGYQVGRVIDVLAESSYRGAIDWTKIYPRWEVLHQLFEHKAGRDALDNVGIWLHHVVQDPEYLREMIPEEFIEYSHFLDGERMVFEHRIGSSLLNVTRDSTI